MIARRDLLLAFTFSAIGILGGYLSSFGMMDHSLLFAMGSYLLLLYFIASLLLKSLRKAFLVVYSAFVTVLTLSLLHILLFPGYDSVAHLSYFVVLLLSYLLNLYLIYDYTGEFNLFRLYKRKKPVIASIVVAVMLISLLVASQDVLYYFGVLTLVGTALAYIELIFLFSPLVRMEKMLGYVEKPSEEELRVKKFVEKYGKGRDIYPFFATWLGKAVEDVEEIIDSLEAKGYLGHNFFAIQNPFFWFSTLISFALGVEAAKASFLSSLPLFLLLVFGIALVAPQTFLERRIRRPLGILFLITSLILAYLRSLLIFKLVSAIILLALISIYFAYKDDEVVSIVFASFFVGALYLFGYMLHRPFPVRSPVPWFVTFAVFALLIYDLYVRGQSS